MSDFRDHLEEAMKDETFRKEYIDGLAQEFATLRKTIDKYKRTLKDAVNELCYHCGQYKNEHLGACDGCR